MTNEGELANRILRARYGHEKEYLVTVDKPIDSEFVWKHERRSEDFRYGYPSL